MALLLPRAGASASVVLVGLILLVYLPVGFGIHDYNGNKFDTEFVHYSRVMSPLPGGAEDASMRSRARDVDKL